ncbi:hypothetical protein Fmac_031647 [Flemingia macrophylla]|uniref:Uncharacterized protein n=1 Tax=Flemingia macrophylla TaxID=520843 RepID=A0ABD1L2P1_9FABA
MNELLIKSQAHPLQVQGEAQDCTSNISNQEHLPKLGDSKITNRRRKMMQNSFSDQLLLFTPHRHHPPNNRINQENGVPCFDPSLYLNRPNCLTRKKLFAVNPTFTSADDTYQF